MFVDNLFKIVCVFVLGLLWINSGLLRQSDIENKKLKAQIERLKEERERKDFNKWLVCGMPDDGDGMTGHLLYLDCGASFVPRYATCFCTLNCIDDYSVTYSNRSPEDCELSPYKNDQVDPHESR